MYAQIVLFDKFDPLGVIALFEMLCAGSDAVSGELIVELVSADGPGLVVSGTRALALTATATFDPDKPGYVILPGFLVPLPPLLPVVYSSVQHRDTVAGHSQPRGAAPLYRRVRAAGPLTAGFRRRYCRY